MEYVFITVVLLQILSAHSLLEKGTGNPTEFCPQTQTNGKLKWSVELATLALGCSNEYMDLHCCAQGYTSLMWYFRTNDMWQPFQGTLRESNQTLIIEDLKKTVHSGDYRCVAADRKGNKISNDVTLNISTDCPNWHGSPSIQQPAHNKTTLRKYPGEDVIIPCTAFYGNCRDTFSGCFIDWVRVDGEFQIIPLQDDNSSRRVFVQNYLKKYEGTTVLHINDLNQSDFGHYRCWAYVSSVLQSSADIYIEKKVPQIATAAITVSVISVFVMLSLIIGALFAYRHRTEINLHYKDRFKRKSSNIAFDYDATILYCGESEEPEESSFGVSQFVQEVLFKTLTETYRYMVFIPEIMMCPNANVWNTYSIAESKSRCLICVISPDLISDEARVNFLIHILKSDRRNVIFITYKPVSNEQRQLSENMTGSSLLFKAIQCGRNIRWSNQNVNGDISEAGSDSFWKALLLQLPREADNGNYGRVSNTQIDNCLV